MSQIDLKERTLGGLHEDLALHLPGIPKDARILDVGCGTGAWLHRLAEFGYSNLHGIDLDIADFATDRATVSQANLDYDDIGLENQTYALITAIELLEHLENPGQLFLHVSRHLAEDGIFLVTTPNIHSALARMRFFLTGNLKQFDAKGDPTHIYPVLLTSLERVLPRHGLKIADLWQYPRNGSITSRLSTRVAAKLVSVFVPDPHPGDILCIAIRKA